MKSKKAVVAGEGMIPSENQYRLTFRDAGGSVYQRDVTASSMSAAVIGNGDTSNLVKVERLDPESGVVLGGFYSE